jgi:hypothetical protein
MGILADREFNLEGWGPDKKLHEGRCGHCHHAVAFKEPKKHACLVFEQTILKEDKIEEERTHYFVMGICPRPRCQQATIVYIQESVSVWEGCSQNDWKVVQESVIYPAASEREDLPNAVPDSLRKLFREASSIEHLSPNGSAFLAGRILEQTLREHFRKPRGRLRDLVDEFFDKESAPNDIHQMMHDIREFRNIAGHPTQNVDGDWATIDSIEASYTLDVVSAILHHIYVEPARRAEMRQRWEEKKQGKSPTVRSSNMPLVGGRELPPKECTENEDDLPF